MPYDWKSFSAAALAIDDDEEEEEEDKGYDWAAFSERAKQLAPEPSLRPTARDLRLPDAPKAQPTIQDTFQPTTSFRVPDQPLATDTERLLGSRRTEPVKPDYADTMAEVRRAQPVREPETPEEPDEPKSWWDAMREEGVSDAAGSIEFKPPEPVDEQRSSVERMRCSYSM